MTSNQLSLADQLKADPARAQKFIADLSEKEVEALLYDWNFWARPAQLTPIAEYRYWLIQAGRGFGKTRCGAQWCKEQVEKGVGRIALVGRTAADVRDTMIEGESGLMSVFPPWERPKYEPSKRRVTFHTGAIATAYSGDEPDQLRGPQHGAAWCDELAAWKYPDSWDQLLFGLRLGTNPQACITTTPRPIKIIRDLIADPNTHITRGSTYDNISNLAKAFTDIIIRRFEGTRLGRQELNAEILDDNPDALWSRKNIDTYRLHKLPEGVELVRIVVAVDPAVTSKDTSDSTGIVVVGRGSDDHFYVLADDTLHDTPKKWAEQVVRSYEQWDADRVVGEVNNGGDLIESLIETISPNISYTSVRATRGKTLRAEPISSLYEKGRVHHVGSFAVLEDQMCDWMPGEKSPDNMDALVWGLTELSDATEIFVA